MQTLANYIDGEFCAPADGNYLDNYEPATGHVYSRVPSSDSTDVEHAVAAAVRAFPEWSAMTADQRGRILLRIGELMEKRMDQLAEAESRDGGKPITRAKTAEMPRAIQNFRYFAGAVNHAHSESYPLGLTHLNYVLRRPRGVAGLISPWNLPLYLLTWKVAPALATGNTAVAKPSEVTPLTAHLFAEICHEAGLPKGVLNIVHGTGAAAGAAIVAHPKIGTISFTGGTATGKAIAAAAAPQFKKVSLELGGKNPTVIFADAPEDALNTAVMAAFSNTGQICLCGSRILVEEKIFDDFVGRFVQRTEVGALVSKAQVDKTRAYVDIARQEGGQLLCGGGVPDGLPSRCRGGYFYAPTVFRGLGPDCRTNQEEIFGPVVTLQPFRDRQHAVELANATAYGLSASVWTRDLPTAHWMAEQLASGTVWLNCWMIRDLRVPFGGVKQSGLGREGGDEALRFFTEPKTVCVKID
jgi:aminomuconate-semialdehyde/2-hydroxymuconate-6-semialdehyde dehydrogenase